MYFEVHGKDGGDLQTILLSSGLGGSANFWKPQMPVLCRDYRVIVYDQAGTGRSPQNLPEDYAIADMAVDVLTLLDELEIERCHFIGHALGGLVGLQIAIDCPHRLTSLVPINAWSSPNPHTLRCFNIRKAILAACEEDIFLQMQALILYPPDWIAAHSEELEKEEQHMLAHFPDTTNLLKRINALSQFDIEDKLNSIKADTFVIANKDDVLVPWQRSQWLAENIRGAKLSVLDYGGHASTVTVAETVNEMLVKHLSEYA